MNKSQRWLAYHRIFFKSCFISELKPHIRREVEAMQLMILVHVIDLAKIQEEKYVEMRKYKHYASSYTSNANLITETTVVNQNNT